MLCLSAIPQVDAEIVVRLARDLEPLKGTKEESLDEALIRTIALSSAGSLSPMAAVLGGVAAQEVLKVDKGGEREGLGKWASPWMREGTHTKQPCWSILSNQVQPLEGI